MKPPMLAAAVALPDADLLARLPVLAAHERTATAELVAHLAALRLRPSLYAAQGYGSLFAYCRQALRLSEDTASNRIHAARACLAFPVILDLLAAGELSLSAVRMLRPHLTMENHAGVLRRARNARREDIERLVAELAPRPDVPSLVRKLPLPRTSGDPVGARPSQPALPVAVQGEALGTQARGFNRLGDSGFTPAARAEGGITPHEETSPAGTDAGRRSPADEIRGNSGTPAPGASRPVVQASSPERYRVQFTIGQHAQDILRRLQTLLRREIPDGDAGAIFERALRLLHRDVEAATFGRSPARGSPRRGSVSTPSTAIPPFENRIRPGADPGAASSRYIPRAVKRAVWHRDGGQCAFVSTSGRRCVEREFLELHHLQPYALKGPPTVANIALRCRRHNAYEAEVVFGARTMPRHGPGQTTGADP